MESQQRLLYGIVLTILGVLLAAVIIANVLDTQSAAQPVAQQNSNTVETDTQPVASVQNLNPQEFAQFLQDTPDAVVIDVHTPEQEHIEGTDYVIPDTLLLYSADLPEDKSTPIALYCRSGNMSTRAAQQLIEQGYTNVINLEGGKIAWDVAQNIN